VRWFQAALTPEGCRRAAIRAQQVFNDHLAQTPSVLLKTSV
jgi:hypothetical protein